MKQFNASDLETASIPLKNPEGVRGEEVAGSWRDTQEQEAVVKEHREKINMGERVIRDLKVRAGRKCCIGKRGGGGGKLNSGGIQAGGIRGGSHSVISRKSREAAGGSSRSESCQEF